MVQSALPFNRAWLKLTRWVWDPMAFPRGFFVLSRDFPHPGLFVDSELQKAPIGSASGVWVIWDDVRTKGVPIGFCLIMGLVTLKPSPTSWGLLSRAVGVSEASKVTLLLDRLAISYLVTVHPHEGHGCRALSRELGLDG